jgi:hypothetical protein
MHAVTMLSVLFRFGQISHHAVFFNLKSGRSSVVPCSPEAWKQFGFMEAPEGHSGQKDDDDDDYDADDLDIEQGFEAVENQVG